MGNRKIIGMGIPILLYHEVYESTPLAIRGSSKHPSYFVSSRALRSQLQIISDLNYRTISLDDLSKENRCADNSKKIILSFDDGYISNYLCTFPAIRNQDMVATFFCPVALVGEKNMMSWSQLKEMASEGMSIQSHGFSHRPLASLNKTEIYEDLRISKNELENNLGERVSYLSLPHGSSNSYVIKAAKEVGYKRICSSSIGYNKGNEYCLRRILIRSEYDLAKYQEIVSGEVNFSFLKLSYKAKLLLKSMIGHQNYLNVYHLVNKFRKAYNKGLLQRG